MEIEGLLLLIERYGIPLIITAVVLWFAIRYLNRRLDEGKHVQHGFPLDYSLQSHSILSTLEYFYTNTIHSIRFTNQFRNLLWTDFLTSYFQNMHEYVEQGLRRDFYTLSKNQFKKEVTDWMIGLSPHCEKRVREALLSYFPANARVADPVGLIIKKFSTEFQHDHNIFYRHLSEFLETPVFPSNKQRLAAILYALKGFSLSVMLTCEHTLNDLNGDLLGLSYKGVENVLESNVIPSNG